MSWALKRRKSRVKDSSHNCLVQTQKRMSRKRRFPRNRSQEAHKKRSLKWMLKLQMWGWIQEQPVMVRRILRQQTDWAHPSKRAHGNRRKLPRQRRIARTLQQVAGDSSRTRKQQMSWALRSRRVPAKVFLPDYLGLVLPKTRTRTKTPRCRTQRHRQQERLNRRRRMRRSPRSLIRLKSPRRIPARTRKK